jgi:hypothetical protein
MLPCSGLKSYVADNLDSIYENIIVNVSCMDITLDLSQYGKKILVDLKGYENVVLWRMFRSNMEDWRKIAHYREGVVNLNSQNTFKVTGKKLVRWAVCPQQAEFLHQFSHSRDKSVSWIYCI